jgi:hypothetical protein
VFLPTYIASGVSVLTCFDEINPIQLEETDGRGKKAETSVVEISMCYPIQHVHRGFMIQAPASRSCTHVDRPCPGLLPDI